MNLYIKSAFTTPAWLRSGGVLYRVVRNERLYSCCSVTPEHLTHHIAIAGATEPLVRVVVESDLHTLRSYVHRIRKKVIAERMAKFVQKARYSVHVPANIKDDKSQDVDLCEGMPLIAHRRWEEQNLKNSARGTIVSVSSFTGGGTAQTDELVISLDRTGELVEMATSNFHRYWRPAFCITVHQSQCTTIDQPFTIFGWHHEHMKGPEGPRGRYVAVSRGTKMENVQICLEKGYDR